MYCRYCVHGAEAGGCQPDQHQQTLPQGDDNADKMMMIMTSPGNRVPGLRPGLRGQGAGQLPPRGVQERGLCAGLPAHPAPHVPGGGSGQGEQTRQCYCHHLRHLITGEETQTGQAK